MLETLPDYLFSVLLRRPPSLPLGHRTKLKASTRGGTNCDSPQKTPRVRKGLFVSRPSRFDGAMTTTIMMLAFGREPHAKRPCR